MLTTSSFLSEAYETLQRNKNKSTEIVLSERHGSKYSYGGVFDRDILDEEGETRESFQVRPDEQIVIQLDGIVWVENLSIGKLTLTNQRLFYQPVYYDIPMTKKNLEIDLDHISAIGHWLVKGVSGIVLFAGNSNAKVEFVSKIPFKMVKTWKALKHINKRWKYISPSNINKMQKNGFLNGLKVASGAAIGVAAVGGAIIGGLALVGKFLGGKPATAVPAASGSRMMMA
jgi:hypothetical protein